MKPPNACPACESEQIRTIATRTAGATLKRIRRCIACNHRYTTYELHAAAFDALEAALRDLHEATHGPNRSAVRRG